MSGPPCPSRSRPHAYRLTYESTHGSGRAQATGRIGPAAQRCTNVFLGVVAEAGEPLAMPIPAELDKQIRCWNGGGQRALPTGVLHFGLFWWSRLHGLIRLELGQHLAATGVEPELLHRAEIEAMLRSLRHGYGVTARLPDRHVTGRSTTTYPSVSARPVTMR